MEGEMGRMRSAGFLFSFFLFSLPFLRIVGKEGEEEMSRKQKYNESWTRKTGNRFWYRICFKKESMPCLPSLPLSFSLLLLHYPNDRSPMFQNPHPFPIPCFLFFSLFSFFPRISTDTLVLIPTYLPTAPT